MPNNSAGPSALSIEEYRALTCPRRVRLGRREGGPRNRRESDVQSQVIDVLRKLGWMVVRINGGGNNQFGQWIWNYEIFGFGHQGFPDLIAFKGRPDGTTEALLVEVKRAGQKPSAVQEKFHRHAEHFGIRIVVCDSPGQLCDTLQQPNQ